MSEVAPRSALVELASKGLKLWVIDEAGLEPVGPIVFAGYDPPSTLPLLRLNELWVELAR